MKRISGSLLLAVCAFALFATAPVYAQLGTPHEVWNEEWNSATSLSTVTLITPTIDATYTVFLYDDMPGVAGSGNSDGAAPTVSWTDDCGAESLGNGNVPNACGSFSWSSSSSPQLPIICANGSSRCGTGPGPYSVAFSVRLKANTSLTFAIPVLFNPDNLDYHVSVQVLGW